MRHMLGTSLDRNIALLPSFHASDKTRTISKHQWISKKRHCLLPQPERRHLCVCAAQILKVDAEKLQQEITERTTPLVIDFYATWCGPCLLLAKELEKVAEEMGDKVKILKVDTDENQELSNQLRIEGLPTMVFVGTDASKPAIRTEGLLPAQTIVTIIKEELTNQPDAQPAE